MKRRKLVIRIVWAAIALAAIAGVAWALRPRPIAVDTVVAGRGDLTATVRGEGRARVKDLFIVTAPVDGEFERFLGEPGDPVPAGATIARIQPIAPRPLDARTRAQARAAVSAARAAVARAEATGREATVAVEHADSELVRSRKLAERGAVPTAEAEHAGHESERRHRALESARAAVREARAELARAAALVVPVGGPGDPAVGVTAPVAGRILRVIRESAGPIAAGTPIVELGDPTCLEVAAELLSSDAASVRVAADALVSGWGGPRPLTARVRRVDPAAFTKISALGLEEQRVRVILDLIDPPPPGLGHDYRVDIAITTWVGTDVVRVPSTALFRSGSRWAVFVVREGTARLVPVELGPSDGDWTVVERGLAAGEVVVSHPSDLIREGVRVRTRT
jgi:HlyD family secretion protein